MSNKRTLWQKAPVVLKGTVADWRDVSFYADMNGRHRLANAIWEFTEKMGKDELKRISFRGDRTIELILHIADCHDLGVIWIV